jgi:hypothetical protein
MFSAAAAGSLGMMIADLAVLESPGNARAVAGIRGSSS